MGNRDAIHDRNFIQSLARGLSIMEFCAKARRPLTLTEIANQTQLTKTAVQRFLNTLSTLGYVRRDENKKYTLAAKVLSLSCDFLNTSSLVTVARPYLDELSAELGKTVNLAVLEGRDTLFLYRKEVKKFMKYDLGPGSRLPCYAGSLGKALLAGLSDKHLKVLIDDMEFVAITPKTITSKQRLMKEIATTRKRGHSICDQELSMDLYSIGVPLLDKEGKVIAAINVSMEFNLKASPELNASISLLLKKGKEISNSLGYEGPYPHYPS